MTLKVTTDWYQLYTWNNTGCKQLASSQFVDVLENGKKIVSKQTHFQEGRDRKEDLQDDSTVSSSGYQVRKREKTENYVFAGPSRRAERIQRT